MDASLLRFGVTKSVWLRHGTSRPPLSRGLPYPLSARICIQVPCLPSTCLSLYSAIAELLGVRRSCDVSEHINQKTSRSMPSVSIVSLFSRPCSGRILSYRWYRWYRWYRIDGSTMYRYIFQPCSVLVMYSIKQKCAGRAGTSSLPSSPLDSIIV